MAELDNKYIPFADSIMYAVDIIPKAVGPDGRRRSAEEIKKGTKQFIHTVYLDATGHAYIIPAKYEDGQWVDLYSPTDVVNAAMGDEEAKARLQEYRAQLKEHFGKDVMSDYFMQKLYDQEKESIIPDINARRLGEGEEPIEMTMPKSPKTANNFTKEELRTVINSALPIQNNNQVPPEG